VSRATREVFPVSPGRQCHDTGAAAGQTRLVRSGDKALRRLGIALFAMTVACDVGYVLASRGLSGRQGLVHTDQVDRAEVVGMLATGILGLFLVWARPRNPIGWLAGIAGLSLGLCNAGGAYGARALVSPEEHLPLGAWVLSLSAPLWIAALFIPATALLVRYPTGQIAGSWQRRFDRLAVGGIIVQYAGYAMSSNSVSDEVQGRVPPVHPPAWVSGGMLAIGSVALLTATGMILGDAVRRAVGSTRAERMALIWLLTSAVLAVSLIMLAPVEWIGSLAYFGILAAIAVGVLRYQALGVELVVRRTLIYALLTGVVLLVFVGVVAGLARLLPSGPTPQIVAAAVIAVGLTPARERIQRLIDRLLYGDRDDPWSALGRLSTSMDDAGDGRLVPRLVAALGEALRVRGVEIRQADAGPATWGVVDEDAIAVPLRYAGDEMGELWVSGRSGESALNGADRRLLDAVAPVVAAVLHSVKLARDLEVARNRVVEATQTERERLRRELHDGLGPALTGIGLGLEAEQRRHDAELVRRIRVEVASSLEDIRRIIDGLGPSALERTDLLGAIRHRADQLRAGAGVEVDVLAPGLLRSLPRDVEAAAYRIADEALTNVARHARAQRCTVVVTAADSLCLQVRDDGCGITAPRDGGVGLDSMRERAESLGGTFRLSALSPGTEVLVELPLGATT
jgi:signal transduction histidine kinase